MFTPIGRAAASKAANHLARELSVEGEVDPGIGAAVETGQQHDDHHSAIWKREVFYF